MMSTTIHPASALRFPDARAGKKRDLLRKALLACGVGSSVLYVVATDVVAASQWDRYSRTTQMVSDLFAVGSPSRPVLVVLVAGVYSVLLLAFGAGVWASAGTNRWLRWSGGALIAYGVSNVAASFFPLTVGNDASVPMHIVATNAQLVLMLAAIGFGAAAFRGRLRVYSIATVVTSVVAGVAAFASAPSGPNLVLGIGERISIWSFLLWVAALAVATWRTREQQK